MAEYRVSHGRVVLKGLDQLSPQDWRLFYRCFRDKEIADWNGAKPILYPFWLFKRLMLGDYRAGERYAFGIYREAEGDFIGSLELYDLYPYPPELPLQGTLGIIIGRRELWGKGYGREAVSAALRFAFGVLSPPMEKIRLTTLSHNRRARAAFKASGFQQVGIHEMKDYSSVLMEVTRQAWEMER